MNAYFLIRQSPHYRSESFIKGLTKLGYKVILSYPSKQINPEDVLIIWNRYGSSASYASKFEKAGAKVLVVENGYIGKDINGVQLYAISRNNHNGFGDWYVGTEDRFSKLNIPIKPWRTTGEHILVCPQRGIGMPPVSMPQGWEIQIVPKLRRYTDRKIIVRPHPESIKCISVPLDTQLENCWAVVIWASSTGMKALVNGIPTFYTASKWIGSDAASSDLSLLSDPPLLDRHKAFHKISWAQWTIQEIESGLPFQHLCM